MPGRADRTTGTSPSLPASAGGPRKCRIVIVDDKELVREGIITVMARQPDVVVCGGAADEKTATELIEKACPDLVLLELFLGYRDGLYFLKSLRQRFPTVRIVVHGVLSPAAYAGRLLQAGACAVVAANASAADLVRVVEEALLSPGKNHDRRSVAGKGSRTTDGARIFSIEALTDRELHVFQLIGTGLGTGRIAAELSLSRKTIEYYCEQIKAKCDLRDAEALRQAALGWIQTKPDLQMTAAKREPPPARITQSRKKPGKSPVVSHRLNP